MYRRGPRELAQNLAWLRVCAIVGQVLAVFIAAYGLGLPVPVPTLLGGVVVLAAFATFVLVRLARPWPVHAAEVVIHFAVDIAVLTYLLYYTGGASNPFVTLFIMPIALAATVLPVPHVIAVTVLCGAAYSFLIFNHLSLPRLHAHDPNSAFNEHLLGMAVNFAICGTLLAFFIARLARDLRMHASAVQRERERALRDEGILAIATQAAGAAHDLNTPLSTMRTLIQELRHQQRGDGPLAQDLALLAGQADRCRDILRDLVAVGAAQLEDVAERLTTGAFIAGCIDRFRLLRPMIELEATIAADCRDLILRITPSIRHALMNLLNNAAEASAQSDHKRIEVQVSSDAGHIEFAIRDFGAGLAKDVRSASLRFLSNKRDGLGIGLALSSATAERLNGDLQVVPAAGGGLRVCLRLPLNVIAAPA